MFRSLFYQQKRHQYKNLIKKERNSIGEVNPPGKIEVQIKFGAITTKP